MVVCYVFGRGVVMLRIKYYCLLCCVFLFKDSDFDYEINFVDKFEVEDDFIGFFIVGLFLLL